MGNNKDDDFSNNLDDYNLSKQVNYNLQFIPNLMKITEDIYVCDVNFAENNIEV